MNTKDNFFSSKNRKLYDIYNTKSIQKKLETNPIYLTNYLEELKSLNNNKDSLNDINKYSMNPCRYISGNKELGDSRVPWKLVKKKDQINSSHDDQIGPYIQFGQYMGHKNELNSKGLSHTVKH